MGRPTSLCPGALGGGYSAEAVSYFAALGVQPSGANKTAIDAFIVACKASGAWTKLRGFGLTCLTTKADCLIDMKSPSRSFIEIGTMTLDSGLGVRNAAGNTAGIAATVAFDTDGLSDSDASVGIYINDFAFTAFGGLFVSKLIGATPSNPALDVGSSTNDTICLGQGSGAQQFDVKMIGAVTSAFASATASAYRGHWQTERTGATARAVYQDSPANSFSTRVSDSQGVTGSLVGRRCRWLGSDGGNVMDAGSSTDRAAAIHYGLSFGSTLAQTFATDLNTLLVALGAS
jgi:hypothetical protein